MGRNILMLTAIALVVVLFCLQIVDSGVKELPEDKGYEVSHNTKSGTEAKMPEHEPATLDEDFIGRYIDVSHFNYAVYTVSNGYNTVSSTFDSTNSSIKSAYNSNKSTVSDEFKFFSTDLSDAKTKMDNDMQEKQEEIDEFIDTYKEDEE